jgi:hypothetical protein
MRISKRLRLAAFATAGALALAAPAISKRLGLAAFATAGALALAAPAANATIISQLDFSNASSVTNFGTVTINVVGGLATVTFDAADSFLFIDGGAADLNVNGTISNVTFVSASPGLASNQDFAFTGAGQIDGLGQFNLTTTIGTASTGQDIITFTFNTDQTEATLLANNGSGFDAAAHVLIPNCTGACTIFVGETTTAPPPPPNVPEPASLAIFGAALAGLGIIRRRRKNV